MRILKKLLTVTPLFISIFITVISFSIFILHEANPNLFTIINTLDLKGLDIKFKIRGIKNTKSKVVIIAADEKSFQTFGQWPWDRGTVFAPLIQKLCTYNPKSIGFDIVWSEKEKLISDIAKKKLLDNWPVKAPPLDEIINSKTGDNVLGSAISNCISKVVLGYMLTLNKGEGLEPEEFEKRLQTLVSSGSNAPTTQTKGEIKFAQTSKDGFSNVQFNFVGIGGLLNIPEITPNNIGQGFMNNEPDEDGNFRSSVLLYATPLGFVESLPLRMAQKELSPKDNATHLFLQPFQPENSMQEDLRLSIQTATEERDIPIDLRGKSIVNFRGPNFSYPNVSLVDVLSADEGIDVTQFDKNEGIKTTKIHKAEFFRDAHILVGVTANSLYDIRPRPFDAQASGVENHATILDNILNNDFIVRPVTNELIKLYIISFILSLVFGYIIVKLGAVYGILVAIITIGGVFYYDQRFMFHKNIYFPGHLHAAQLLFQYFVITVFKFWKEESDKKEIREAFGKYVSASIINEMLKDPNNLKLGGQKRDLSILFSDIRGFTELSEKVEVGTLTLFLNEYLGSMTDILQANEGTLDKYIGDAVMGFWGAPLASDKHAILSVKTAVEMITKVFELNKVFKEKYNITIDVGIGINTGSVSVGNFGSQKVFEYTVIGDNVNLASRLEGLNKYYGTRIIISETTKENLPQGMFHMREIDNVKVKGKHKPVKIYEVFPDVEEYSAVKSSLGEFETGLKNYYAQQWMESARIFLSIVQKNEKDKVSKEFISRCEYFMQNPPGKDWDGSWEMKSK